VIVAAGYYKFAVGRKGGAIDLGAMARENLARAADFLHTGSMRRSIESFGFVFMNSSAISDDSPRFQKLTHILLRSGSYNLFGSC